MKFENIDVLSEKSKVMAAILGRAQEEALPDAVPDRNDAVAYCNACINSGLGALAALYPNNPHLADVGAYGALKLWLALVEKRFEQSNKRQC